MKNAAFGIRVHSGWAALVCISNDAGTPEVVDRGRIVIIDSMMQGAKQPYHFAENLGLEEAKRHLQKCAAISQRFAVQAISEMLDGVTARKYRVLGCAMLLASGRALPSLEKILASHALIHTAEGEFFRNVVRKACEYFRILSWVFVNANWRSVRTRPSVRLRRMYGDISQVSEKLWVHRGHRTRRPRPSRH